MQDRKPKVTGKIHIPSPAPQPALRARTRNVVDPSTPPTRPSVRTAASLVNGSPNGLAPRRVGIVRASTTSVLSNGAGTSIGRSEGSDVGINNARVKRPLLPSAGSTTPTRIPAIPPPPPQGQTTREPTTPNPSAYALQRDSAAPLVSPRSGRREAGRRTRVALAEPVEREAVSPVQGQARSARVRVPASVLSRSTTSTTYAEEPEVRPSSPSSLGSGSEDDASVSEEDGEPPPLVISEEIRRRILDEEDAKRSRKIADLEISNASLMHLNRTLEAEVARKTRLISSMKRQLRASGQVIAPVSSSDTDSSSSTSSSRKGKQRASHHDEDPDVVSAHQTTRTHASELADVNARLEALVRRGREAVQRVEAMTSGGKGKVLHTWDQVGDDGDGENGDGHRGDGGAADRSGSEQGGNEEGAVD